LCGRSLAQCGRHHGRHEARVVPTPCKNGNRCIMWLRLVTHQLIITDLVTRRSREQPTYNEAKHHCWCSFIHSFISQVQVVLATTLLLLAICIPPNSNSGFNYACFYCQHSSYPSSTCICSAC
jgi:hypothetical protein